MPAPAFGSIGTRLGPVTTGTPAVAAPAGVQTDDIIVVYMQANATTTTITARPPGFAAAEGSPRTNAGGVAGVTHIEWKRATGADTGTYDFTLSASVGVVARAVRYTGCIKTGNPWDSPTASIDGSPSQPQNAPPVSITTLGPDRLLCYTAMGDNALAATWTPPVGFTTREGSKLEVSDRPQTDPGPTELIHATSSEQFHTLTSWLGALIGTPAPTIHLDDELLLEGAATIPAFGSIGAKWQATSTSHSIPVPSGVTGAPGEIVALYFTGTNDITFTITNYVAQGWTLAENGLARTTAGGDAADLYVLWRRPTGVESGTYSLTTSASVFVNAFAARYTGCVQSGSPWETPTASAVATVASQNAPNVALTTQGDNRLLCQATANWHGDEALWSPPSGMTERAGGSALNCTEVADKLQAVAGATGNLHASNTATASRQISWLGALMGNPAQSGFYVQEDSSGNFQMEPFGVYFHDDDMLQEDGTSFLDEEDGATLFQLEPKIEYAVGDTIWMQDWTGQLLLEDSSGGFQLEPLPPSGSVDGTAVGSVAKGAGQSANGVGSAGASAVGTDEAQGAGQSASGTATGSALVIGTTGQGAGQSRSGAGSAAGTATGTTSGQGAGQAVSGVATGAAAAVGAVGQAAGQAGAGTASGAALVVGTWGQGSAQGVAGTAVAGTSAVAVGTTAQGAGQGRDGAATGAASATGTTGYGAGQGRSGIAAASALVIGTTGQAAGQGRSGAGSGAAGAVGATGQGSGQATSGATAAAATATGSSSQAAGQASSGAASGGATALGSPGQGAGLGITGSAVAGTSATGTGTSAQAAGQAGSGAATGAAAAVGSSGSGAGQGRAGAGSGAATATGTSGQAAGQAVNGSAVAGVSATGTGTSAQAAGQAASGAATGAATSVGSSAQAAGQGRPGASTGGAAATGTSGQGVGQGVNGSAIGGVSATAIGSTAQGTGQAQAATAGGAANGTGSPARGTGQGRSGVTTATAAVTGSTAQGTGQGWSGSGGLPATALGSTAQGVGLALSGTAVATFGRFIHRRVSGSTDRREDGRTHRGSGANYIYGYGVIPRPTGRIVRPNTGPVVWP